MFIFFASAESLQPVKKIGQEENDKHAPRDGEDDADVARIDGRTRKGDEEDHRFQQNKHQRLADKKLFRRELMPGPGNERRQQAECGVPDRYQESIV